MTELNEKVYGCDPVAMMEQLAGPIADNGLAMVLTSLLSDVQEMLLSSPPDVARKAINRVKYIMSEKLPKVYEAPADLAVRKEVGELRKLHAETTPGVWHALPGRARAISGTLSNTGYTGFDILRGIGRQASEGKRNVQFCARIRNAAPALLDAAELVEHVLTEQEKLPRDQRDAYIVDQAQSVLSTLKQSQL